MYAAGHQADIAKTRDNLCFVLIWEDWRLANAVFGPLWKLGGVLGLAVGWLGGGWLAG